MLDSVIGANKNTNTNIHTLLEEYKYDIKKNKIENLINNDLSSSDNESDD